MTTPPAAACLDCRSTHGWVPPDSRRPWRARGLCRECYSRNYHRSTVGRYPLPPRDPRPAACLGCGAGFACGYQARGLCSPCYQRSWGLGTHTAYPACGPRPVPRNPARPVNPEIPTGIITPAMLGIKPGQPPTDPNFTPRMVRAVANLNARAAFVWLVARGMDAERARHLATWQPAEASTPGDAERRAA